MPRQEMNISAVMTVLIGAIGATVDMNSIKFAMKNYLRNQYKGKRFDLAAGPSPLYESDFRNYIL